MMAALGALVGAALAWSQAEAETSCKPMVKWNSTDTNGHPHYWEICLEEKEGVMKFTTKELSTDEWVKSVAQSRPNGFILQQVCPTCPSVCPEDPDASELDGFQKAIH